MDKQNRSYQCRTLLNTCSSKNFISEGLATKLQLPRKRCHIPIGANNKTSTVAKYYTTAIIRSQAGNYIRFFSFIIIPTISDFIPYELFDRKYLKIPRNISLADPNFHRPSPVDMLFGAEPTLSLICVRQINLTAPDKMELYLQKTRLGWVIGGRASPVSFPTKETTITSLYNTLQNDPPSCSDDGHSPPEIPSACGGVYYSTLEEERPTTRSFFSNTLVHSPSSGNDAATATTRHSISTVQADLTRFWEIEEGPQIRRLSESDAACEEYFRLHTTRNSEGRYVVALPFNNKKRQNTGESANPGHRP